MPYRVPPAPFGAMQPALQSVAGLPWPSQPTPYASAFTFMAPPAWPMYMPSYMPRPPTQQAFMQAEFKELARQRRELKVQCMTRPCNLNAVRDARVATATSVTGSRLS